MPSDFSAVATFSPPLNARKPVETSALTAWATALLLVCVWILLTQEMLVRTRDGDFLNLYAGFSLARDGQFAYLHDLNTQYARERQISPAAPELSPFNRLHFYAALLSPVSWLPQKTVWPIWLAGQLTLLLGCFWWAARRFGYDALLLGAVFYPPFTAIAHGQDAVFMTAIFIAAWSLFEKKRPYLAGLIFGLALMKWHLILLFPLAFVVRRQWKMLAGFATTAGAVVSFSLLTGGVAGLRNYYLLMTSKFAGSGLRAPQAMLNVFAIPASLGWESLAPGLVLAGLVILSVCWIWLITKENWLWFSATAVGSILVVPHVYVYDVSALLIVIWLVFANARTPFLRRYLLWMGLPVPYLMVAFPPPYSAIAAISLLFFLGALCWEARSETTSPQTVASPQTDIESSLISAGHHLSS